MNELRRYDYAIQRLLPHFWLSGFRATDSGNPRPGDLVMLQSAPDSEWHLSFYIEDQDDGYHMLESLKTGKLCRWGNVGFVVISREWVSDLPRLRWTDTQLRFNDLYSAEVRRADFWMYLPFIERLDGSMAFLGFRTRHNLNPVRTMADGFDFSEASRGDLRSHLWKWHRIHKGACAGQSGGQGAGR